VTLASKPKFQSIQEATDSFLALFPHRYDYLWADHPQPTERPEWKTESRHPLSDRLIQQGSYLYGVRFGPTTRYILLDIDKGSIYHPSRDRFAWKRLLAALESLGLVQAVLCTSSYSEGMHLYIPFQEEQKTWEIALAIKTLLENTGFKLTPGQLEVFPNCKAYNPHGAPELYNGHRLPMQAGSYLLNADLQMIWGDQTTFVRQWQFAQRRNTIKKSILTRTIKAARRKQYQISHKADKFLNDLNTEIEQGWTGKGQTNRLLGRITMRSYIFAHVENGGDPLEGEALVQDIVAIARSLPGYADWCQHQHEIEKRARDWVKAVETSRYFPYSTQKTAASSAVNKTNPIERSWNQRQKLDARERIRQALADLLEKNTLPAGAKARMLALARYHISGTTLYKHPDLWHPFYFQPEDNAASHEGSSEDCLVRASSEENPSNLLGETGCNSSADGHSNPVEGTELTSTGCNLTPEARLRGFQAFQIVQQQQRQVKQEQLRQRQITRMQGYLDSGDPILVAEAIKWGQQNPGVLEFNQLQLPIR